jgi:SOS-response transcriptional repressor LexA
MKKKELAPESKEECAALKAIFMEKRKTLGLTQEKAAAALGMNQGSFSHYLNGRNLINTPFAVQVSRLLGVPVDSFSPRIAKHIAMMTRSISGEGLADMHQGERDESTLEPAAQRWIKAKKYPLISWTESGNQVHPLRNKTMQQGVEYLPSTEDAGENGYWLTVEGSSMSHSGSPSFPAGTRILIKPQGFDLISGKYYIAENNDGEKTFRQFVKEAGTFYLVPLNPSYKPVEIGEEWLAIGRVVDVKMAGL